MPSQLIVISGPIASGKSTVAKLLADDVRSRGRSVAVLDLDLVYEMLSSGRKSDDRIWALARQAAASFVTTLLTSGVDLVILEGEFWTDAHRAPIQGLTDWPPQFVTLELDFETALDRAQGDPTRVSSRNPALLRPHYDEFKRLRTALLATDLVLSTAGVSASAVASMIRDRLMP